VEVLQATSPKKILDPTVWVEDYGDYLYSYAFSRVRNESVAEDIVQETLLAAIQSYDRFSNGSSEKTWLTGILKHKITDHFRRSGREFDLTAVESDMSDYDYLFERDDEWKGHWNDSYAPVEWKATPEEVLQENEFQGILTHCLNELPERVANAFTMREMDGFSCNEICNVLSVSPNNYWVMLHRARLHLRRCIEFNWFRKV
jgi:RNA polymerase sigma-70 factor (ECF subfamily)